MLAAAACATVLVAGCNNNTATDAPADGTTTAAETPTTAAATATPAAGWDRAALGLREAQLIGADLLAIDNVEVGEIRSLLTGPEGRVDRLLVELDDTDPDRFVEVPVQGLTVLTRGADIDIVSAMTAEQLKALPDVSPPAN
jgi:hypothetical protein